MHAGLAAFARRLLSPDLVQAALQPCSSVPIHTISFCLRRRCPHVGDLYSHIGSRQMYAPGRSCDHVGLSTSGAA